MLPPSAVTFKKVETVANRGDPGEITPDPIVGEARLIGQDADGNPVWSDGVRNPSQINDASAEDGPPTRLEFEVLRAELRFLREIAIGLAQGRKLLYLDNDTVAFE